MNKIVLFFVFYHNCSCLPSDKFVIPCLFTQYGKIPMDGCRITFSLRLHVIQHSSIGIFPYCVNKQGITNNIILYYIIFHYIILYFILYYIISYHIISYHIISYHIISYHIISYHIIRVYRRWLASQMVTLVMSVTPLISVLIENFQTNEIVKETDLILS